GQPWSKGRGDRKGNCYSSSYTWEVGQGKQVRALDFFLKWRDGSCGGGVCHECIASHEDVAQIRCNQRRRES
ncbi:unnamed protein product, partial [Brassica rapa subsp. trilocularis]